MTMGGIAWAGMRLPAAILSNTTPATARANRHELNLYIGLMATESNDATADSAVALPCAALLASAPAVPRFVCGYTSS